MSAILTPQYFLLNDENKNNLLFQNIFLSHDHQAICAISVIHDDIKLQYEKIQIKIDGQLMGFDTIHREDAKLDGVIIMLCTSEKIGTLLQGQNSLDIEIDYLGVKKQYTLSKDIKPSCDIAMATMFKDDWPVAKFWVEYYLGMGVGHFYLYMNQADLTNVHKSLKFYIDTGIVTLISWDFPYYYHGNHNAQTAEIIDSHYRFGKNHKWIGYFDLDEFVITYEHNNLTDLLHQYDASYSDISYLKFGCLWAKLGNVHIHNLSQRIKEGTTYRAEKIDDHTKCFINPLNVQIMGVHIPHQHKMQEIVIEQKDAAYLHYSELNSWRPSRTITESTIKDERINQIINLHFPKPFVQLLQEWNVPMNDGKISLPSWVKRVNIDIGLSWAAPHSQNWIDNDPTLMVFGFEPNPKCVNAIISETKDTFLDKYPRPIQRDIVFQKFFIIPAALSHVSDPFYTNMFIPTLSMDSASLLPTLREDELGKPENMFRVPVYNLSDFFELFPFDVIECIDYIKIDVQGIDIQVLKGSGDWLKERVAYVTVEPETRYRGAEENSQENITSYMESLGFIRLRHPRTADPTFLNRKFFHKKDIYLWQYY